MKIVLTSDKAQKQWEKQHKAMEQSEKCPECGSDITTRQLASTLFRCYYQCECGKCGCQWFTDKF